jgi:hypothetical protein
LFKAKCHLLPQKELNEPKKGFAADVSIPTRNPTTQNVTSVTSFYLPKAKTTT